MTKKRECATAYHEAGHAVAAFLLRRRLRRATIIPDEDSLGHIRTGRAPPTLQPDISTSLRDRTGSEGR